MKLKFVFWAFAAIQFLTLLAMMFSPREIAESFGIEYSGLLMALIQLWLLLCAQNALRPLHHKQS